MIPIMDFERRSATGPVMKVQDFEFGFAMKVRDLVAKYEINYSPEQLVVDDATADAVFAAGVELLADVGLYHMETQRVITYTKEEIQQIAQETKQKPGAVTFGRGEDEMTLRHRTGKDTWAPTLCAGAPAVAHEGWFVPYVQSFAQEDRVVGIGVAPNLPVLGDVLPNAGTLSEVYVGTWEQRALKEALYRAGRPNMNLGLLSTVTTVGGTMAMIAEGLREPYNTQIGIQILPEQKLDWSRLLLAQFCQQRGIEPWQSSMSCIGGFCRDAAETAVGMVANALGQLSYAHGTTLSYFPTHLDGSWATRGSHWAFSAAARATERNMKLAVGTSISGDVKTWRTPVTLWQSAAVVAVYVASGLSYAWIAGHTGLEARLIDEMMRACVGLSPDEANELAQKSMVSVDEMLPTVEKQVPFPEAYDLKTVHPKPQYEAGMLRAQEALARLGVPFR